MVKLRSMQWKGLRTPGVKRRRGSTIPITVVWALLAAESTAAAQVAVAAVRQHSQTEWETLAQVEAYLNSIRTMRARFLQVSGTHVSKGTMFLAQPGRMRLEYDPPSSVLLLSNGWHLMYRDTKLDQTSYVRLNATPAGVLLQTSAHLKDDVTVMNTQRVLGSVAVSLIWTNDPDAGELTLLFGEHPFILKQWRVKDLQGQIVTVSLYDVRIGLTLDPDLFRSTESYSSLNLSQPCTR
ncbi:Outer membrane lipoprotein carrier protein LolA [invertebrate metagenome]|uniref:Outer membrane lipoprotein carrier protein LolA n=1 Tax=invertebrate metagenome TaxID=1711999 RepID=A0A484H6J8_9ZZZZ